MRFPAAIKVLLLGTLGVVLLLALILISAAKTTFSNGFMIGESYSRDASTFDAETMEMVAQLSEINLPSSAKGLNLYYDGSGIDDAFVAKIQIPTPDVPALTSQLEPLPNRSSSTSLSFSEAASWWQPDKLKVAVHRDIQTTKGAFIQFTLGEIEGQWYLYIQWFQT